jgi:hypothetical protein
VSKVWVCGRSFSGIPYSNPAGGMDVCLVCVVCCDVEVSASVSYVLCCHVQVSATS